MVSQIKLSPTATPLEPLEKSLYMTMSQRRDLLENKKVIIAVSGGIDSVVLMHALAKLQSRLKYQLIVAHINHGVRAIEADTDEEFVIEMAKKLKLQVISEKFKIAKASENNLRQKRYEILFAIKKKLNASCIITAHHKDDLIETRLMRLLHGTGIHGLKAMSFVSDEGVMRPMLNKTRRDVEDYARKLDLRWRNDATNSDTTKFRNWIRRNWIAKLRADHPGYLDNLFESLERLVNAAERAQKLEAKKENALINFQRDFFKTLEEDKLKEEIFNFLRQNTEQRVTSKHVDEFKKRLTTNRKNFEFRLAGRDWVVNKTQVVPRT
ncbi:MAG: tRNA lysidine(34) synthetase TilS [Oligoflexia bacterium]|nr:tRNA lysidine(34) synthetase TilS [Oligoflexia bacterium]